MDRQKSSGLSSQVAISQLLIHSTLQLEAAISSIERAIQLGKASTSLDQDSTCALKAASWSVQAVVPTLESIHLKVSESVRRQLG